MHPTSSITARVTPFNIVEVYLRNSLKNFRLPKNRTSMRSKRFFSEGLGWDKYIEHGELGG